MSTYAYLFNLNRNPLPRDLNLTKEQTRPTAYHAIMQVLPFSRTVLSGLSEPPKTNDPLVKLFGRRCRYDAVCNRLAEKLARGEVDHVEIVRFMDILQCFSRMLARDIIRARRKIAREPMLTAKGKEVMNKAVWYTNFWEAYMALPSGAAAKKRRIGSLADLLEKAMKKAEKKLQREMDRKTKEPEKVTVKEAEVEKNDGHLKSSDGDKDEDGMKEVEENGQNTVGEFGEGFEVVVEVGDDWKRKSTVEVNTAEGHELRVM